MATITVRGDLRLGGVVFFDTAGIPKKVKNPRVLVSAFDPTTGDLIYAEGGSLAQATGDGTDPLGYSGFLLGGGGSRWLSQGGPAHCTGQLFFFDNSGPTQQFVVLATCSFEAAG